MVVLLLEELARAAEVAKAHHGEHVGVVPGLAYTRQRVVAEGELDDLGSAVRGLR
tara:strand:- start:190 stop:354 length:165 start_codon:yes stop_codon:yes gene_type:complete